VRAIAAGAHRDDASPQQSCKRVAGLATMVNAVRRLDFSWFRLEIALLVGALIMGG